MNFTASAYPQSVCCRAFQSTIICHTSTLYLIVVVLVVVVDDDDLFGGTKVTEVQDVAKLCWKPVVVRFVTRDSYGLNK